MGTGILAILAATGLALLPLGIRADFLRARTAVAMAMALALAGSGLWLTRNRGRRLPVLGMIISVGVLFTLATIANAGRYATAPALTTLALAWAFVLSTEVATPDDHSPPPQEVRRAWLTPALVLVAGTALWVMIRFLLFRNRALILDEVLYLFQARHLLTRPLGMELTPGLEPLLRLRQTFVRDGVLYGQYPPGWPLALALTGGGKASWIAALASYWAVGSATFAIARRFLSHERAVWSLILVALNPFFLYWSATLFPHAFTAALLTGAAALIATETPGGRPALRWRPLSSWGRCR